MLLEISSALGRMKEASWVPIMFIDLGASYMGVCNLQKFTKAIHLYMIHTFCVHIILQLKSFLGPAWWLMHVIPVISALWEVEVGESRDQEIETILANMMKPRLF